MRPNFKMMRKFLVSLLLVAASIGHAAAAQPLRVNFDLVPSESVVGIPVSIRFTITNTGALGVPFPRRAELLVRNARGQEFAAWCNTREVLELKEWPAIIGAGETKVVWLRTDGTLRALLRARKQVRVAGLLRRLMGCLRNDQPTYIHGRIAQQGSPFQRCGVVRSRADRH